MFPCYKQQTFDRVQCNKILLRRKRNLGPPQNHWPCSSAGDTKIGAGALAKL